MTPLPFSAQLIYVALFGRPGDADGMTYWNQVLQTSPGALPATISSISASEEYRQQFEGKGNATLINAVYTNLFNHQPDKATLAYWDGQLAAGASVGNFVSSVAISAAAGDQATIQAKMSAATRFTDALDTTTEIISYASVYVRAAAKVFLSHVHDSWTLEQYAGPAVLQPTVDTVLLVNGWLAPEASVDSVHKLYLAYFGRAADPAGLAYWSSKTIYDTGSPRFNDMAAAFGGSPEYQQLVGQGSNALKVGALYQHLFGREGEAAGVDYWAALLDKGTLTIDKAAVALLNGARGSDRSTVEHKALVAREITQALDTAVEQVAYQSAFGRDKVVAYLAAVDKQVPYLEAMSQRAIDTLVFSFSGNTGPLPPAQAEPAAAESIGVAPGDTPLFS